MPDRFITMTDFTITNNIYDFHSTNFYSVDGTGNNLQQPNYGATGSVQSNLAPLDYGDGISSPGGTERPNPRVISNTLGAQNEVIPSDRGLTNLIWAFGQFLDHDLILTPENHDNSVIISVPAGDPFLDPNNTGNIIIPMDGTAFVEGTGTSRDNPAQITNNITTWIDGSNIYGSDTERNHYLRQGTDGLLKISQGNLLPFGNEFLANANPSRQDPTNLFAAGDIRANENSVLVSMHTLFVREHNRLAAELAIAHPDWSDEQLYQRARQINIAQYQKIIYDEYLPSLVGIDALPVYGGYDESIDPSIDRSFSSAGFRIGHTQLSSEIPRWDEQSNQLAAGNLTLAEVFFRSTQVIQETGIDPILRGISSSLSQNVDLKLIDDVRNLLFSFGSHAIGRDLFAMNVQRGRLNGLSDYNTVREAYGLSRVTSFANITSDVATQNKLAELYGTVDNLDLYVGLLAEDRQAGSAVGETFRTILVRQFTALRSGDRLYYENIFTPQEIGEINNTTFSDIIRRNTNIEILQDNAFSLVNYGAKSDDVLNGGLGNDSLFGKAGNDTIYGHNGDDILYGSAGDDYLFGGFGDDKLVAGNGVDYLDGGDGDDKLIGNNGDQILVGGTGNDKLVGNNGNDVLDGGSGNNLLKGGVGEDRFILSPGGIDRIMDFELGIDTLSLAEGLSWENIEILGTNNSVLIHEGERIGVAVEIKPVEIIADLAGN